MTGPALLEDLVARLGVAATVSLLAEVASRRSHILWLSGEDLKAVVLAQDARTLDRTAHYCFAPPSRDSRSERSATFCLSHNKVSRTRAFVANILSTSRVSVAIAAS